MAIRALDIGKVVDYICKDDDPDDPTVFKLGTLSSRDKGAIQDTLTSYSISDDEIERIQSKEKGESSEEGGEFHTRLERSKMNWEAVRRGLKGWENFLDSAGEPVAFRLVTRDVGGGVKKSVVPNDLLDMIPFNVMVELAEKIMDDGATEDDAGNSQEPSSGGSSTRTGSVKAATKRTEQSGAA